MGSPEEAQKENCGFFHGKKEWHSAVMMYHVASIWLIRLISAGSPVPHHGRDGNSGQKAK